MRLRALWRGRARIEVWASFAREVWYLRGVNNKARLTYRYAPACGISGSMVRNCWYTVYDRSGRIVIETASEDLANQAAEQFDEIVEAELEDCS